MAYHIFLIGENNFKTCTEKGVYGGIHNSGSVKSESMNAEILSGFWGIKSGDFVFFYVKNKGIYGLWRVVGRPFYDETVIWDNPTQVYPYRVRLEPAVRKFDKPVALSDILDLRDKGKIWTFDLGIMTKKNHFLITGAEGKEIIRLLLRNNPVYNPPPKISDPYFPLNPEPLPLSLECDTAGHLRYEGYLNAWFMKSFAEGKHRELIGNYKDFINYVPTSFNKVMDIFLTHVDTIDSLEILYKFTCIELKTKEVSKDDLNQVLKYENWLIRKLADGDSEMIQSILVGFDFDKSVIDYCKDRMAIDEKTVRLIKYRVNSRGDDLVLKEVNL